MAYPGDLRLGYLFPGFPVYWHAPGARSHLHVPGTPERAGGVRKTNIYATKKIIILCLILESIEFSPISRKVPEWDAIPRRRTIK